MKFEITFFMVCFSMLSIGLTGCSFQTDSTDSSESVAEYNINGDESLINSENLDLFSEVAGKAEENEDTITLPIVINESKEITDSATVKLLSAKFEENEIKNFQNISQYYTTIPHYEKYFDNNGSLNSDYVFAELNIGITSQKSWDDLYSADLAIALNGNTKIIATTIQKFPYIVDSVAGLKNKRFAVIIDEAHSSTAGKVPLSIKN